MYKMEYSLPKAVVGFLIVVKKRNILCGEKKNIHVYVEDCSMHGKIEVLKYILLLPARFHGNILLQLLKLSKDRIHVSHVTYAFELQYLENDQQLHVHGLLLRKVKSTGFVIVILCHLASSSVERNIVSNNGVIDPICSEPKEWDVCSKYKDTRNPQCIDDFRKSFYEANSWTTVVDDYNSYG